MTNKLAMIAALAVFSWTATGCGDDEGGKKPPVTDRCENVVCGDNATCEATTGNCVCDSGFEFQGDACVPVSTDRCEGVTCGDNATCEPATGDCACDEGFELQGDDCVPEETDLCENVICEQNEVCVAETGACVCAEGFERQGDACVPVVVDPCEGVTCGANASCEATTGACVCDEGFELEGDACVAIVVDPCEGFTCGANEVCEDQDGTAVCVCDEGYIVEDGACVEPPVCHEVVCGTNEVCEDQSGTAACVCADGFTDVAGACVNTQMVDCTVPASIPDNASANVIPVQITWNGTAWSTPEVCGWSCDAGYVRDGDVCVEPAATIDGCMLVSAPTGEFYLGDDVEFLGTVFSEGNTGGEEAFELITAAFCGTNEPITGPVTIDDLDCAPASYVAADGDSDLYRFGGFVSAPTFTAIVFAVSVDEGNSWQLCDLDGMVAPGTTPNAATLEAFGAYNGGFERWNEAQTVPTGWEVKIHTSAARETTIVRSGDSSIRMQRIGTNNGNTEVTTLADNHTPIVEGRTYRVEAWFLDNDTRARSALVYQLLDANGTQVGDIYHGSQDSGGIYTVDSTDWQELSTTFVAPAGATQVRVAVRVFGTPSTTLNGVIYMDDYRVVEVPVVD